MNRAVVVLEIFSGRADPTWTLDPRQTADFRGRLAALPSSREQALPAEAWLGYRGVHVSFSDAAGAHGEIADVRHGRVAYRGRVLQDVGRALERALLAMAPHELAPLVREVEESF